MPQTFVVHRIDDCSKGDVQLPHGGGCPQGEPVFRWLSLSTHRRSTRGRQALRAGPRGAGQGFTCWFVRKAVIKQAGQAEALSMLIPDEVEEFLA